MMNQILDVEQVSVFYNDISAAGKKKKQQVLDQISFSILEHEIVGLVGESGCGKSTLAKTILGLNRDFSGTVSCQAKYPQMIFQDPYNSLNPAKTIRFILSEPLKLRKGCPKEKIEAAVFEMLDKVGLSKEYADRYPRELSGGQRQRICIAQTLMLNPGLLIADEPVSALDVTIQEQIMELLLKLQREMGFAVLFISHDLRIVYQICDRVMIMREGKIVEEGTTDEVYFNPKHPYTRSLLISAGIDKNDRIM